MERIFIPWWILILTAGLFVGLALAALLESDWLPLLIWIALATFSVRVGLVHRARLKRYEDSIEQPPS